MPGKIIIVMLTLTMAFSCASSKNYKHAAAKSKITGSYDIGLLNTETSYDVLLYINKLPVGVSAFKTNNPLPVMVKSSDNKTFKITGFTSISLVEAIKSDNSTYSYLATEYRIKKQHLKILNSLIMNGEVSFQEIINSINPEKDMTVKHKGDKNQPDTKKFTVLRLANVYNLHIKDSKNRNYILQLCVENFVDSDKL